MNEEVSLISNLPEQPDKDFIGCPEDPGHLVSMTSSSWLSVCKRSRKKHLSLNQFHFCGWICKGKSKPRNICIVSVQTAKALGLDHTPGKTWKGICSMCGSTAMIKKHLASDCCPTCSHVRTHVNKRPGIVLAALRDLAPTVLSGGSKEKPT